MRQIQSKIKRQSAKILLGTTWSIQQFSTTKKSTTGILKLKTHCWRVIKIRRRQLVSLLKNSLTNFFNNFTNALDLKLKVKKKCQEEIESHSTFLTLLIDRRRIAWRIRLNSSTRYSCSQDHCRIALIPRSHFSLSLILTYFRLTKLTEETLT